MKRKERRCLRSGLTQRSHRVFILPDWLCVHIVSALMNMSQFLMLWTWVDLANTKGWACHDLTEMEEINLEKVFTS